MNRTANSIGFIIGGVIVLVFAILLADVVIDVTTTALTNASIGSFAGASAIGGLVPFIYFTVVILIAVGMMGIGARSMMGIYALPLFFGLATPYPVAMMLIALLAMAAVSYRQYRAFRSTQQME